MQLGQCSGDPESPASVRGSQCRSVLIARNLGADGYVELEGLETGCRPVAELRLGGDKGMGADGILGRRKETGRYAVR